MAHVPARPALPQCHVHQNKFSPPSRRSHLPPLSPSPWPWEWNVLVCTGLRDMTSPGVGVLSAPPRPPGQRGGEHPQGDLVLLPSSLSFPQDPRGAVTLGVPIPVQKWGCHLPAPATRQLLSLGVCRSHRNKMPGQRPRGRTHRHPPWEESFTYLQGPCPSRTRGHPGLCSERLLSSPGAAGEAQLIPGVPL